MKIGESSREIERGQRCLSRRSRRALIAVLWMSLAAAGFPAAAASGNSEKSMLLGKTSPRQILKITTEWKSGYEAYNPDAAVIQKLIQSAERVKGDLRIDVVYGSWCSDSEEHVPRFLRIQHDVGRSLLPARFIGVDHDKKDPEGLTFSEGIERVPTFILLWKGVEMGRIIETPKVSVEADLLEILDQPGRPAGPGSPQD